MPKPHGYWIYFRYRQPSLRTIAQLLWQAPRHLRSAWRHRQLENRLGGVRFRRPYRLRNLTLAENATPGEGYEPSDLELLTQLFRRLELPRETGLVDYGCGLGCVLMAAAEYGFHTATGVEVAAELCRMAVENLGRYRRRRSPQAHLTVLHLDAASYRVGDNDAVFHFFKPFDAGLLARVLDNIAESVSRHPRPVWVLYNNPDTRDLAVLQGHHLLAAGSLVEGRIHCYTSVKGGASWLGRSGLKTSWSRSRGDTITSMPVVSALGAGRSSLNASKKEVSERKPHAVVHWRAKSVVRPVVE